MASNSKVVLYSFWRSSCSWRVRAALSLKEIPYELKSISLFDGEQHSKEFKEMSPTSYVPALHIDGVTLIESLSIMNYLEETRPKKPLLPENPIEKARVRAICEVVAAGIQPLQNIKVRNHIGKEADQQWSQKWINEGFEALEKILQNTSGNYAVGNAITLADCCLVPQIYNAFGFRVDMTRYPVLTKLYESLIEHPSFKETRPENQPGYPKK